VTKSIAVVLLSLVPALALAAPGIRFDTALSENGKVVASPSVWVPFGEDAVIEVPGKVRIVASAGTPEGSRSHVQATIYRFVDGEWKQDWKSEMDADVSKTPSFEKDLSGGAYRVVVMPRVAEQPSSRGS